MTVDIMVADGRLNENSPVTIKLLEADMNPYVLRPLTTLRKDEWIQFDAAVVRVARQRLNALQDLISRGLIVKIPNAMGVTVVQHETMNEMIAASVSMDGITRGKADRVLFSLVSTPLPIIHEDFWLSARALAAGRKIGAPLDTTMVEQATIQVVEKMEDLLLNGISTADVFGFGSSTATLYGYTTRANRNTVSIGTNWDVETGTNIIADVKSALNALHTDRMFGPYMVYVPSAYWVALMDDFKAHSDKTILQRIKEVPGVLDVKPCDLLSANNVLIVQLTSDVVDMLDGIRPMVVYWSDEGGMRLHFKVMAIYAPRVKVDYDNRSGVCHIS